MKSLIFVFATLFVCCVAETFRYNVKLPYLNTTVTTEAEGRISRNRRHRIKLEIDDVDGKSKGGETYLDFDKKLLVVQTKDKRSCYVISFPNITFEEAKNRVKTAPTPDSLLKGVNCDIKDIPRPFGGIPDKVRDVCKLNRSDTVVKRVNNCKTSEDPKFCAVSGFVDDGLACILGRHFSELR